MSVYFLGEPYISTLGTIGWLNQPISGATIGQPVYFNGTAWTPSTYTSSSAHTPAPQGVLCASNNVVVAGPCPGLSGLVPGSEYFVGSSGNLSTTSSPMFVGVALSANVIYVCISATDTSYYKAAP